MWQARGRQGFFPTVDELRALAEAGTVDTVTVCAPISQAG